MRDQKKYTNTPTIIWETQNNFTYIYLYLTYIGVFVQFD